MKIAFSAALNPVVHELARCFPSGEIYGHDNRSNSLFDNPWRANFDFTVSPSVSSSMQYVDWIEKYLNDKDLYFPMLDEELILCIDRADCYDLFSSKGYCFPRSLLSLALDKKILTDLVHGPVKSPGNGMYVIKPRFGRGSANVFITGNKSIVESALDDQELVVQSKFSGPEYTIDCFILPAHDIELVWPRVRLSASSVSTVGRVDVNTPLIYQVKQLIRNLKLEGYFNLQGFWESGFFKLIEINPRLAGSSVFSDYVGCEYLRSISGFFSGDLDSSLIMRNYEMQLAQLDSGNICERYYQTFCRSSR